MVRRHVFQAMYVLLCAGAFFAWLAGCAAVRSLPRSLEVSTVDMGRQPAEEVRDESAAEVQTASAEDHDEAEDALDADDFAAEGRIPVAANAREPSLAGGLDSVPEHRPHKPRPAADRKEWKDAEDLPQDELTVLLTAYEKRTVRTAPNDAPPSPTEDQPRSKGPVRLQVPRELPGSDVQSLQVPSFDPRQPLAERRAAIQKLYPALPDLPFAAEDDPTQPQWSLPELEDMAWENHPALMQAAAQVEAARGTMIQAGLHPNPEVGWEQDTIGPGIQGYKGPYVSQQVVTGGKLKLARCAAAMDYENANLAYQRTRIEIATRVRNAFYDVLVSQQRRRMLVALARFTDDIYHAQIELVAGGQAAPYEPLQLRVFAVQARNSVAEAHNGLIAAGRRLGAAAGMTDAEEFHVAGSAEDAPAKIDYHAAKAFLLENHSELRMARNQIVQSQYLSRLEYIRPRIPDINTYLTYQHAYEVAPFVNSYNFQVGVPIPVFDRNQGNILSTQSTLLSRERAFAATKNDLTGRLAEILARYDTARIQSENYQRQVLPDQVRTYRGVYSRYREGGQAANDSLNFGDVIVAQQTLAATVNGYSNVLDQMWQAYVDAADLLQIEDLATLSAWFGQTE